MLKMNVPEKLELKLLNGRHVTLEGSYNIKDFSSLIGFNESIVRKMFNGLKTTEAIKDRYDFLLLSHKVLGNGSEIIQQCDLFNGLQTKLSHTELARFIELSNKLCAEEGIKPSMPI